MQAFAAAGAAFLLAVLWFDLMFDVQTVGGGETLPPETLASITSYYRRVTTDARPMNSLIALVMLLTLIAIGLEIWREEGRAWLAIGSFVAAAGAVGLALGRTVRNAVEFGGGQGSPAARSHLARKIFRDHLVCLFAMTLVLALQLAI